MGRAQHFLIGGLVTVAVFAAGLSLVLLLPRHVRRNSAHAPPAIPEADWGHLRASGGQFEFVLGPLVDQRRRVEVAFSRVLFTAVSGLGVADRVGGDLVRLRGRSQTGCTFRAQGNRISVTIAIGKCVPPWVRANDGSPVREWIRVENLVERPRVVLLNYLPQ